MCMLCSTLLDSLSGGLLRAYCFRAPFTPSEKPPSPDILSVFNGRTADAGTNPLLNALCDAGVPVSPEPNIYSTRVHNVMSSTTYMCVGWGEFNLVIFIDIKHISHKSLPICFLTFTPISMIPYHKEKSYIVLYIYVFAKCKYTIKNQHKTNCIILFSDQ